PLCGPAAADRSAGAGVLPQGTARRRPLAGTDDPAPAGHQWSPAEPIRGTIHMRHRLALLAITAILLPATLRGDEPPAAQTAESPAAEASAEPKQLPEADENGWRPLLDGKSLTNWKPTNFGG